MEALFAAGALNVTNVASSSNGGDGLDVDAGPTVNITDCMAMPSRERKRPEERAPKTIARPAR